MGETLGRGSSAGEFAVEALSDLWLGRGLGNISKTQVPGTYVLTGTFARIRILY